MQSRQRRSVPRTKGGIVIRLKADVGGVLERRGIRRASNAITMNCDSACALDAHKQTAVPTGGQSAAYYSH